MKCFKEDSDEQETPAPLISNLRLIDIDDYCSSNMTAIILLMHRWRDMYLGILHVQVQRYLLTTPSTVHLNGQ